MSGLVAYPFKLRSDCWVHLRLPSDFSADDRNRIVAVLHAMVEPPSVDAVDPSAGVQESGSTREKKDTHRDQGGPP